MSKRLILNFNLLAIIINSITTALMFAVGQSGYALLSMAFMALSIFVVNQMATQGLDEE